jgi:hypothetical protein
MNTPYYKPSGKTAEFFIPYFALIMLIAIPILSVAYIYLIHYIPSVYVNLIITVACGLGLGTAASHAARFGKARNSVIVIILTLVAVLILKYVQWSVYIPLIVSEVYGFPMAFAERWAETIFYLARPGDIIEAARIINEYGVWSFNSSGTVTGGVLCIVWIAELIIIAAAAVTAAWNQPLRPFSEAADGWYAEVKEKVETALPEDVGDMVNSIENGVYKELIKLASAEKTDKLKLLRLTFFKPPDSVPEEPYYMLVEQATEKKGKAKFKVAAQYLAIDAAGAGMIMRGEAEAEEVIEENDAEVGVADETGAEADYTEIEFTEMNGGE